MIKRTTTTIRILSKVRIVLSLLLFFDAAIEVGQYETNRLGAGLLDVPFGNVFQYGHAGASAVLGLHFDDSVGLHHLGWTEHVPGGGTGFFTIIPARDKLRTNRVGVFLRRNLVE